MMKIFHYTMNGMGYGAVAYLFLLAMQVAPTHVSPKNAISLLLLSAAIGVLSMIFDEDYQGVPWPLELGIHLVGTAFLVMGYMLFNDWSIDWSFWGIFVPIYIVVWLVVSLDQHFRVVKINRALQKRNK
ncbi:hypothetical protein IV54_GL001371 [Levilactobacillus paucivorans]|uniref:DUF3021 domain-containing protein n=1 Tax=Levilactobacillus paucivorans TaxID=616990 RepID=A0A0R2LS82_9LACO|nr:DUF3021 domain-containing protein [Levilactobacillus paucivorans]KRO04447.1 hypothetical protein IV54_GL001371 [Levilactobacillus paucivorans]